MPRQPRTPPEDPGSPHRPDLPRRPAGRGPGPAVVVCALVGLGLAAGAVASAAGPPPSLVLPGPAVAGAPAPVPEGVAPTTGTAAGPATGATAPADPVDLTGVEPVSQGGPTTPSAGPPRTGPRAAATWVLDTSARSGIPVVALRAYADATLAAQAEDPACALGWTTLAAIGAVESGHGSHGGAALREDGTPTIPVVGPALDGYGVAAIPATPEGTALHGDTRWEHAVGPLQFLPSTWARWGADGDDDGRADPHDLDDAALAAARYLCAGDRDLTTPSGWQGAVLSYNRSEAYAADVLALADGYAAATSP